MKEDLFFICTYFLCWAWGGISFDFLSVRHVPADKFTECSKMCDPGDGLKGINIYNTHLACVCNNIVEIKIER